MRWLAVAGAAAMVTVGVAGCGGSGGPAGRHSSARPSGPEPSASASGAPGVLTGSGTGRSDVAVLVNVEYKGGTVTPAAGVVPATAGRRVKVHVTSDQRHDIVVPGFPDKTSDVEPGDPEGVSFVPSKAGDVTVAFRDGTPLVTFRVS